MSLKRIATLAALVVLTSVDTHPMARGVAPEEQGAGSRQDTSSWSPVKVPGADEHPPALLQLAAEFRAFARDAGPGIPDFAALDARHRRELPKYRERLAALKPDGWPVHSKIDYLLLRSEMDNLEFELRVWRPVSRNPSFYVNEAIDNVQQHLTAGRYLRGDLMPYSAERARAIVQALNDTDKYLEQGRRNLTEMVPELADIALRHPGGGYYTKGAELKYIDKNYDKWARMTAEYFPEPEKSQLVPAAARAAQSFLAFGQWLEQNRGRMTGKFAIGLDAVDWYHRQVLFLPYTSSQLMLMADMERARTLSFLEFEEHKHRFLPKIQPAKTYKEYKDWDDETAIVLRRWYVQDQDILSDRDYMLDVRSEQGEYLMPFGLVAFPKDSKPWVKRILLVPPDHWRAVYSNMGFRTDPGVLHGHEYWPGHYYEGEVHRHNPCPVRRAHRDGVHSQGWCFYHEELPVLLDFPYVRGPRGRELPYLAALQRAERISLSVQVLSGEMTPTEAMEALQRNVPALGPGKGAQPEEAIEEVEGIITRGFDHCQTGKLQIWKILADRKMQLKEKFDLKEFHDQIITMGSVPLALLRWELTGLDDEVKQMWEPRALTVKN